MAQRTDLKLETAPQGALSAESVLILGAVADHFTKVNPTDILETHSLLVAFGVEAYRLTDGKPGAGAQRLAAAAFTAAPTPNEGATRGEYALVLRRAVAQRDGNHRAIPTIPRPRTEPVPTTTPKPHVPAQPTKSRGGNAR